MWVRANFKSLVAFLRHQQEFKLSLLSRNIELAQTEVTEEQLRIARDVMERFFRPLAQVHWENLEVTKYWEEMAAAGLSQNSDI